MSFEISRRPIDGSEQYGPGRPPKYPFRDMQIGECFRLGLANPGNVRSCAASYAVRNNKKFTVRKQDGEYFCWRIA